MQVAIENAEEQAFVPPKDSPCWTFHVAPSLFTREPITDLSLTSAVLLLGTASGKQYVQCVEPERSILPKDVQVFRPYTNSNYYVAGTPDRKMGWEVPLDPDHNYAELTLLWSFRRAAYPFRVRHSIRIRLRQSDSGHVFSTLSAQYIKGERAKNAEVIAYINPSEMQLRGEPDYTLLEYRRPGEISVVQDLDLLSHTWDYFPFLDYWGQYTEIHEIEHAQAFTTYIEEHRSCSCIEIPASVLEEAISTASGECGSVDGTTAFSSLPSLVTIFDWWNNNAPNEAFRHAGDVEIWCRVEDCDEYWNAYCEVPNVELKYLMQWGAENCARFGDSLLIFFVEKREMNRVDEKEGIRYLNYVDGSPFTNIDANGDNAYFAWEGLTVFPQRFPATWSKLKSVAMDELSVNIPF